METALVPTSPNALATTAEPGLAGRFAALPARTRLGFVLGLAALAALLVVLALGTRSGDYKVLYANLSDQDGGLIIDKLAQMNVPYRHAEGGSAILVPADRVYDLRMKLGSAGLPKSSVVGYELLDKTPFGQTQGQERVSFQRAREGELVRSISALDWVKAARVHLALPNQNGFFREQQKPSAAVVLTLHPGRTLDRTQIAGIVHLVSSSVPELHPKAVSVIDGSGTLLSGEDDRLAAQGLDAKQLQYLQQVESSHLKRVMELLEPVVGRDNLRATVTADIDFAQSESTSEEYKPNQGAAPAAVRALRTEESTQPGGALATGIPGAATNQPPAPPTAPINGAVVPLQAAQGGAGAANGRREAETRFEIDRTVRVTRSATGTVRRLNAAVVVNHRHSVDAKGKAVSTPLTPEELDKLTALVQQGIGFNAERGDSVRVVNAPFHSEAPPKIEEVPLWQQPWLQDLLRAAAAPAALALLGLVLVFTTVRPALRALLAPLAPPAPSRGGQLDTVVADAQMLPSGTPPALEAPRNDERLQAARTLAKQNPVAVANIMRNWVSGEPA